MNVSRRQDVGILAGFALLFFAFVAVSWAKWPLLTADSARELYVPFQIRHGALIYQDFYYLYGPVAPYLNAGLLAIFGERLEVLYAASVLHVATILGLFYALCRQLLTPWPSAAALFLLFTNFTLGRDIWGYFWPYAFAATYGVLLGLLLLLSLARFIATHRRPWLFLAGIAIGLSLMTKLEYAFAATATGALFLAGRTVSQLRTRNPELRTWALEVATLVLPAAVLAGGIAWRVLSLVPLNTVLESVWPTQLMAMWNSAGAWRGTPASWVMNVKFILLDVGLLVGIVAFPQLLRWLRAPGLARWVVLAAGALALGILSRLNPVFWLHYAPIYWMGPSFMLFLGILAWLAWRLFSHGRLSQRAVIWGLVAAYGCLVATRTLFLGYNDYTRYQAPVAMVAWVALAGVWLPTWAAERGWLREERRFVLAALSGIVLSLGGWHLYGNVLAYRMPHQSVSSSVGTVQALPEFGKPFNQALSFVNARIRPGEAIVAAPMEASFYLFTGRDNVLKEDQLFYGYLPTPASQEAAIQRMKERRVRYVLLSNYGFNRLRFGESFMQDLGTWLKRDCRLVAQYGESAYGISIYETPFVDR